MRGFTELLLYSIIIHQTIFKTPLKLEFTRTDFQGLGLYAWACDGFMCVTLSNSKTSKGLHSFLKDTTLSRVLIGLLLSWDYIDSFLNVSVTMIFGIVVFI